jgi:AraC-like DNA-binding protein
MPVERHVHVPSAPLRPYLLTPLEAWTRTGDSRALLREVPFPGVPVIFDLGGGWRVDGEQYGAFVAGLHTRPAFVQPEAADWSCIELRVTPLAAHRILTRPMHELANRTVALGDLLPEARELSERLRDAHAWPERFALVEAFLLRRLAGPQPPTLEVEWSWQRLRRTEGRAPIGALAAELGWSHRRLIARFREQIGITPKSVARVMRFDRAVAALRSPGPRLAEVAFDCGYFDQAHLNRDFRELAGTTPTAFVNSVQDGTGASLVA